MSAQSAGLLLYRRRDGKLEVLLVHPGGPFWRKRDEGAWSLPKGELAHEGGLGLAKRLGTQAAVFPGAHGGFESHAAEFAARLREVLEDQRRS